METHDTTERLSIVEWLLSVAPEFRLDATDLHPTITLNGELVPVSEWPLTFFGPDDDIGVYAEPRATGGAILAWAAVAMAAIALVMVLTMKTPKDRRGGDSTSLEDPNALANQVRWGDPIPEIAGAPRTFPDYIMPPRRFYVGRTQQWVDSLVCIGIGEFVTDISQVFIGDTPAPNLGNDIAIEIFQPGETIPAPYNEWWHTPEEVGFTSLAGAGLNMDQSVSSGSFKGIDFGSWVPLAWTDNIVITGSLITGDTPVPSQWEAGLPIRVEAVHPVVFDGNSIQSALLDTLQLETGDVIEVLGERDGEYTISAILPGTGGGPGAPATATGSAPPARYDFGVTHASLGVAFRGTPYTVSLTSDLAGLAELVAAINSQLNASPLRARATSAVLELYQIEPYAGGQIELDGDVPALMGTPVLAPGVAATPAVGTRYVVAGADFGQGTEVTAVGRDGMLYTITDVSGNSITVSPPDVAFWGGFPASVSDAQSNVAVDRGSLPGGWLGPFVAVPLGELADAIEVDIFFPGGLVHNRRSGGVRRMTVRGRVQWREVGTQEWSSQSYSISGSSPDQIGFTIRAELPRPMRVEVRLGRDNAPSSNPMHIDKSQWAGLRARIVGAPTSYPGLTLAHVRLRSGDKVSGAVENKMSVRAMRILPTVEDPNVMEPTRDIAPFFIHMMQTVGYGRDLLDMPHIQALHEIWRDRGDTFDLSVNATSTLKTVANYCLQAGFAELTLLRGKISAARDAYRMGSPPRVYSPQELVTPLIESTESIMPDDIDGVDIEYVDYLTGRTLTESYRLIGDEGNRVEVIQAPGVSGRTQAWRLAARRRRMAAYRRTAYKGTTELSAMNSYYMDYVGLQDGIPEWGQSAFVIDYDGPVLTLSEDVQPTGGPPVIMIRRADGTASPPIPVTVSGRRVTLPSMPPDVFVTNDPNAPTVVYIGRRTQVVHEALMTSVRPSGEARVEFQAVNMDNRVYLEDDMGPDQVILTSILYPIEFSEDRLGFHPPRIDKVFLQQVINDIGSPTPPEAIFSRIGVERIRFRDIINDIVGQDEAAKLSPGVTRIRFRDVIKDVGSPIEIVEAHSAVSGIYLERVVVPTDTAEPLGITAIIEGLRFYEA